MNRGFVRGDHPPLIPPWMGGGDSANDGLLLGYDTSREGAAGPAQALVPSGLPGATANSRYVGATTSGAPTLGTFKVGDYAIDQTGTMYICTAAGTPGTWVPAGAGTELGYAEITSGALTTTNVGVANRVDAAGLIVSVTIPSRPILVEFFASIENATINDGVGVQLVNNIAGNANNTPLLQQSQMVSAGIAGAIIPCNLRVRLNPGAGTYSYKVMFNATVGGTANIVNAAGQPAFIRVTTG